MRSFPAPALGPEACHSCEQGARVAPLRPIAAAVKAGAVKGDAKLSAKTTQQIDAVPVTHMVEDEVDFG
jgi:hypothetical protein